MPIDNYAETHRKVIDRINNLTRQELENRLNWPHKQKDSNVLRPRTVRLLVKFLGYDSNKQIIQVQRKATNDNGVRYFTLALSLEYDSVLRNKVVRAIQRRRMVEGTMILVTLKKRDYDEPMSTSLRQVVVPKSKK